MICSPPLTVRRSVAMELPYFLNRSVQEVDANDGPFPQELSGGGSLPIRDLAQQRHRRNALRHARPRSPRVPPFSLLYLTRSTIVSESELKTVLCTPASGLMLLNCLHTDPQRFRTLSTLVIVLFSLSLLPSRSALSPTSFAPPRSSTPSPKDNRDLF